jgi:hypothetical protein
MSKDQDSIHAYLKGKVTEINCIEAQACKKLSSYG